MEELILTWGIAYVLGAIPIGRLIAKFHSGEDIWEYRDGTSSVKNLLYVLGTEAACLKVVLDLLKGVIVGVIIELQGYAGLVTTLTLLIMLIGYTKPLGQPSKEGSGIIPGLGLFWYLFPQISDFSLAMFFAIIVLKRQLKFALTVCCCCLMIGSLWLGDDWVTTSALLISGSWFICTGKPNPALNRTFT